jgi:hypothetical protein
VADGGEDAFDRICCSYVLPVLGWEIVEGQKYVAIFGQFRSGFFLFHAVGLNEKIECGVCVWLGFRLPNVMQVAFGFGLNGFGHGIQDIGGFMHPTARLCCTNQHYLGLTS